MPHSVEEHFHIRVAEYDQLIRTLIPEYETMHAMIASWCTDIVPSKPYIIDLGGGTGGLTAMMAEKFPNAEIEVWDIDTKMLEVARHRLAKYGSRMRLVERSFEEPLPACDAVVACIALHQVKELDQKEKIYSNIYGALRSPGIFVNGDATMNSEKLTQQATYKLWKEFMMSAGMTEADAQRHFANWKDEDRYFSLEEEFSALNAAGFSQPGCFWKYGPMAVYGGVK